MRVDLQAFLNPITQVVYQLWRMEQEKQNQLDYYKQLYPLREQFELGLAEKKGELQQKFWEEQLRKQIALEQEKEKALMQPLFSQAAKPIDIETAPGGLPVPTSLPFQDYFGLPATAWASLSNAPYPFSSYKILELGLLNQQKQALAIQKFLEQSQLNRARTYYYLQRGKAAGQKKTEKPEQIYKTIDNLLRVAQSAQRKLNPATFDKVKVQVGPMEMTFNEAYDQWRRIMSGEIQAGEGVNPQEYYKTLLSTLAKQLSGVATYAQQGLVKSASLYAKKVFGSKDNFEVFLQKFSTLSPSLKMLVLLSPFRTGHFTDSKGNIRKVDDLLISMGVKDLDEWKQWAGGVWGWIWNALEPYSDLFNNAQER